MTEYSYPWDGLITGDATLAPYSDDEWSDIWKNLFQGDLTEQGVICGYLNELAVSGVATLHPDLPRMVRYARHLGFASITIDTNGYLFHDILEKVNPAEVDVFSFSLDGATAETNDRIRGKGSYEVCLNGIRRARGKGFHTSLIYTVSSANLRELPAMGPLLVELGVEHFFIQVLGLRGRAASAGGEPDAVEDSQQRRESEATPKQKSRTPVGTNAPHGA